MHFTWVWFLYDRGSFIPSKILQLNEFKAQCAEPVTGSSKIDACGLKNLETKSQLSPTSVTITPPGSRFIWSNNCLSKIIANVFGLGEGGV